MRICGSFLLLTMLFLQGCSEGGIGGTGTGFTNDIDLSGQANKGPFAENTRVTLRPVDGGTPHASFTMGRLGAYVITAERMQAGRIDVAGRYFSESLGVLSDDEITISAIVMGDPDQRANVNVATHLIHERVLTLMDSGMSFETAKASAESELTLVMSSVIPAPGNEIRFADLVVMNAAQTDNNLEGNAWLLALSSLVEQVAIERSEASGASMESELEELMGEMATDLADDGMMAQSILNELLAEREHLNPDVIHGHLLALDDGLRHQSLEMHLGLTQMEAESLECAVSGSRIECMSGGGMHQGGDGDGMRMLELSTVVADMNRFIDTDGDGIVNHDDEDDDNDGIVDAEDDTPYGGG